MMAGRADKSDGVMSPLVNHAYSLKEHKQHTRRIALVVAIVLIGGVSLISLKFSRSHTLSLLRAENVGDVARHPLGMDSFEGQHGMTSQDVLHVFNATGLSTGSKLAHLDGGTGAEVLKNLAAFSSFVVFAIGTGKPHRRAHNESFLTVSPESLLPVDAVNIAAGVVEAATGRRLFPLKLTAIKFDKPRAGPPYAVYEVASGSVWLDESVFVDLLQPNSIRQLISHTASELGKQLSFMLKAGVSPSSLEALAALFTAAFGLAVSSAFSSMVPLWFCIACPVVLGLAAPLLINVALGGLASTICRQMSLPDEECLDLWMGALLLGFVLTMAAAVPIFKVCKMYECEHQSPPAAARV